jgi:hypothetical protein
MPALFSKEHYLPPTVQDIALAMPSAVPIPGFRGYEVPRPPVAPAELSPEVPSPPRAPSPPMPGELFISTSLFVLDFSFQ